MEIHRSSDSLVLHVYANENTYTPNYANIIAFKFAPRPTLPLQCHWHCRGKRTDHAVTPVSESDWRTRRAARMPTRTRYTATMSAADALRVPAANKRNCGAGHGVAAGLASGRKRRAHAAARAAAHEQQDNLQERPEADVAIEFDVEPIVAAAADHDARGDVELVAAAVAPELPEVREPAAVFDDAVFDDDDDAAEVAPQPDEIGDADAAPLAPDQARHAQPAPADLPGHAAPPPPRLQVAAPDVDAPPVPALLPGCEHLPRYQGLGAAFRASTLHDRERQCPAHLVRTNGIGNS